MQCVWFSMGVYLFCIPYLDSYSLYSIHCGFLHIMTDYNACSSSLMTNPCSVVWFKCIMIIMWPKLNGWMNEQLKKKKKRDANTMNDWRIDSKLFAVDFPLKSFIIRHINLRRKEKKKENKEIDVKKKHRKRTTVWIWLCANFVNFK